MNKLGKAWGQDMQRSCLVQLAGLAVAIFVILPLGCCLIFIPLSFASASPPGDDGSIILLAASSTLFLLILFGSVTANLEVQLFSGRLNNLSAKS